MPEALVVAERRRQHQARIRATITAAVERAWNLLVMSDLTGSWLARAGPAAAAAVRAGQYAAAVGAADYVSAAVGNRSDPDGQVNPAAFVGYAADGRPLGTLLYLPVITTKQALGRGVPNRDAFATGLSQLTTIAGSEVADAGRAAVSVAGVAEPAVTGYVRTLRAPSCSRCTILAGRVYRWNEGFLRHPRCDCVNLPTTARRGGSQTTDPRQAFDALTRDAQDRVWTKTGAQAIRDGADPAKVVNARRGMYEAGGFQLTREAAAGRGRLMPEAIYREAGDNRGEALRLLRRYGYLT